MCRMPVDGSPSARVSPCVHSSLLHMGDHAPSNSDLLRVPVRSFPLALPGPGRVGVQYSTYLYYFETTRCGRSTPRVGAFSLTVPSLYATPTEASTAVRVSLYLDYALRLTHRPYPTLPTPTTTLPLYPCPCPLPYTSSRYVTTVGDRRWPFVRCSLCHPSPMNLDRPSCINLDRPSSINLDRVSCIISIDEVHQSRSTRCINLDRRGA